MSTLDASNGTDDRQPTRTELEMQEGRRQAESRAARLGISAKKTNDAAAGIPFSLDPTFGAGNEPVDTGLVAALSAKQVEGIKRETPPAKCSPAPKGVPEVAGAASNVVANSTPAAQQPEASDQAKQGEEQPGLNVGDASGVTDPGAQQFMMRVVPWPEGGSAGYINLHWFSPRGSGMRGRPFTKLEDFMDSAVRSAANPKVYKDIYFCLSLQSAVGNTFKGQVRASRSGKTALRLKAIWLDIDVKPDKGYTTKTDARCALDKFVKDAALPFPTAIVDSGGGFHVYWISDRPLTVAEWSKYAEGLEGAALKFGLKCDHGVTTDCARVLRVPGTWNRKNENEPPRAISIKWLDPTDYAFAVQLADLPGYATGPVVTAAGTPEPPFDLSGFGRPDPAFAFLDPSESLSEGLNRRNDTPLDAAGVFQGCPHFQHAFKTHGADASQGLWMLDVFASTFFDDGYRIAHTLSKGYETYTREETDRMWERKQHDRKERGLGWPSCKAIENEGCKLCATCAYRGKIKSPLNLAAPVASRATDCGNSTQSAAPTPTAWNVAELKVSFANVPHRRWLYGTYLIRGEITVLAAPGGAGKTALATGMAVEIATGTRVLEEKIFGGDLKVLFVNGEDGGTEVERRVWAFCLAHANKIAVQSLDRLFVAGANDVRVQHLSFLRTTDRNFSMLDRSGFEVLEAALETLRPDVLILDPLVAFCGGGNMNDNAVMAQVIRELKRLATKFECAVLIVHHTRKGADDGNPEAISGASATVNLARRAIMPVPMTQKEAEQFCVPPSERFRYFKLVDAKSNLAPRSAESPWYRLHSVELPNPEPPVYPHGDSVQAVERMNLSLLQTATVTADDQKIRDAILDLISRGKVIDGRSYPYSPSPAGASKERALLDDAVAAVRNATASRQWPPDDLKAATIGAIKKMKTEGLLVEKEIKELVSDPGRFRRGRGLAVAPSRTAGAQAANYGNATEGAAAARGGGQLVNPRSID